MNFQRYQETLLYTEESPSASNPGFFAFLLCDAPEDPPAIIPFDKSWDTYNGYYLFLRQTPADLNSFAAAIEQELEPTKPSHTGFAWVEVDDQEKKLGAVSVIMTVAQDDQVTIESDTTIWVGSYGLPLKESASVIAQSSQNEITGFLFTYPSFAGSPPPAPMSDIHLPLLGGERGSFQCQVTIGDFSDDFQTGWNIGCRYFFKSEASVVSQYFPIFELEKDQQVLFQMNWDPVDPLNPERSYLAFAGLSFKLEQDAANPGSFHIAAMKNPEALETCFRTIYGKPIQLVPLRDSGKAAKLVFNRLPSSSTGENERQAYYLAPAGDFELVVANDEAESSAATEDDYLLCGLAGTEYIGFTPRSQTGAGDRLSFHSHRAAYAPLFPLPPVNLRQPNSPPVNEELLNESYTTSWATVTRGRIAAGGTAPASPNVYYSQPHGAALYANDEQANEGQLATLNFYQTKMADLGGDTDTDAFPLAPYAGTGASESLRKFETEIISPTRKQKILDIKSRAGYFALPTTLAATIGVKPVTTPQGLLATIATDSAARWQSLLLARNTVKGAEYNLIFNDVNPALQDAFQTNQQFLVVTQPKDPWNVPNGTTFENLMLIEDWPFRLLVGTGNVLGDYRNVMIFKFVSGKLSEHVKNPSNWTSAGEFNDTSAQGLAFLSQWLQDYIEEARVMAAEERRQGVKESYFQKFLDLVDSDTWNGILVLKAHIELAQFPPDLKGLISGIDLTQFYAHHFGVEVNFIQAKDQAVSVAGNSSLFGLIYYVDPAYANQLALGGSPNRPVAAAPGDYDFKVLTLKVLFENTAVKTFESKLQVTINRCFDDQVVNIVEPNGTIVSLPSMSIILDGAYEEHDEQSTFTFSSSSDQLFRLNSNVLGVVEFVQAQFATLTDKGESGDLVKSRFTFTGYMNYMPAKGFDFFSFGGDWLDGKPGARQGLYFSNLYIDMNFPEATPTERTFLFNPNFIAFNMERSRARDRSFFANFPLKLAGITSGAADKTPSTQGFLPVSIEAPFTGLKGAWNGLQLQLDMGTVGALAENAGLISQLIGAWSPASGGTTGTYDVTVGMKLPGGGGGEGKLLSLQGILSLSVSNLQLLLGETQEGDPAYMLKMTQIALKFLGIKFPPSGNTVFFLFGDPNPGAPKNSLGWYAAYNKDTPPPLPPSG